MEDCKKEEMLVHLHQHVCVCTKPAPGYSINNFFGVRPPLCSFGGSHPGGLSSPMCEKILNIWREKIPIVLSVNWEEILEGGKGRGLFTWENFPNFPNFSSGYLRYSCFVVLRIGESTAPIMNAQIDPAKFDCSIRLLQAVQASQGVCDGNLAGV